MRIIAFAYLILDATFSQMASSKKFGSLAELGLYFKALEEVKSEAYFCRERLDEE